MQQTIEELKLGTYENIATVCWLSLRHCVQRCCCRHCVFCCLLCDILFGWVCDRSVHS